MSAVDKIGDAILDNFNPPDDAHETWWIAPKISAAAVIAAIRAMSPSEQAELIGGEVENATHPVWEDIPDTETTGGVVLRVDGQPSQRISEWRKVSRVVGPWIAD